MHVTILGAGAIGLGSAALLASNGHACTLWSPTIPSGPAAIESRGAIDGRFPVQADPDLARAIAEADAILLALPAWAHRTLIEALAPTLRPSQMVVISSHASLGALHLRRLLDARSCTTEIVAWGTTAVTGRRTTPFGCTLSNLRSKVDAAAIPARHTPQALARCATLFGDRFVPRADLLAIQLSNLNPQNHLAMLLCNLTRAERGEDWGNYWSITPAVGRMMEALDAERIDLAAQFGAEVRTLREHFHLSFQVPLAPVWDQAAIVHGRGNAPLGPKTLDTRYITEDIPYGIAATEQLGRIARTPTPLHTAGAELFAAATGRDLRAENDILPALNLDSATIASLKDAVS